MAQRKLDRLQNDEATLSERKATVRTLHTSSMLFRTDGCYPQLDAKAKTITEDLNKVKKEMNELHARRAQTAFVSPIAPLERDN